MLPGGGGGGGGGFPLSCGGMIIPGYYKKFHWT